MDETVLEKELEKIRKKNGALRPQDVVDFARDETTGLHAHFDWDDTIAAEKHRRQQARTIIQSIIVADTGNSETRRAYLSVEINSQRVYLTSAKVLNNKELRNQEIRGAIKSLQQWNGRYGGIKELSAIAKVIAKAI